MAHNRVPPIGLASQGATVPRSGPSVGKGRGLSAGLAVAGGLALGLLAFAALELFSPSAPHSIPSPQRQSRQGLARGLQASEVSDGRLLYSLQVGAVRLEAGRLGPFRVGFIPALALDDAELTVYAETTSLGPGPLDTAIESALLRLLDRQGISRLAGLGPVAASPFRLRVVQGGRELMAASAERGELDLKRREIRLEGRARVAADGGLRRLEGKRLRMTFRPDRIWAEDPSRLVTPEGMRVERGLVGDLRLRHLSAQAVGSGWAETAARRETARSEKE